eukprot:14551-Heterococcus_DN1.PRE.2
MGITLQAEQLYALSLAIVSSSSSCALTFAPSSKPNAARATPLLNRAFTLFGCSNSTVSAACAQCSNASAYCDSFVQASARLSPSDTFSPVYTAQHSNVQQQHQQD